jgi:hypothetical protein
MSELLNKIIDLIAAHPSSVIAVLVTAALLCAAATPVLSLHSRGTSSGRWSAVKEKEMNGDRQTFALARDAD